MNPERRGDMSKRADASKAIGKVLQSRGGHLECSVCGHSRPLGDVSMKLTHGWPEHCGYTMSWITRRQEIEQANPGIHETVMMEEL